jgi:hypothetical protein
MHRIIATAAVLLLAAGGFCGMADGLAGPLDPLGLIFLGLAGLVWRKWDVVAGSFTAPHFDVICGRLVGSGAGHDFYRGTDDHYRRDGQQNYRELG